MLDQLNRRDPGFNSWQEYEHFLSVLRQLADEGAIKEIVPSSVMKTHAFERWFVDGTSGCVYQLVEPDPPARGLWSEIHCQEYVV